MKAIYRGMCPNCRGAITDERLSNKNPCEGCLSEPILSEDYNELIVAVRNALKLRGTLKDWEELYRLNKEVSEIEELFEKSTGFKFWSAQRTWVKRIIRGKSFSIIAPTGMGKSTFGAFISIYFATKGKKSYIVVPTTPLVIQTVKKIESMLEKANVSVRLVYYHGNLRKKEKEEALEKIRNGDFDILITSSQFLATRFKELLKDKKFDLIFVDDVDAFLKASKNIDRSLIMLGFSEEIIGRAWEVIKLKKQLAKLLQNEKKNEEEIEKLNKEIEKIEDEIEEYKRRNKIGILIVASATGSAKGDRIKLYRELLGFEVGSGRSVLRNIVDTYLLPEKPIEEHVVELLRKLGKGGLIFVPIDKGIEYAEELTDYLKSQGFKVELVSAKNKKGLELFEKGEIDYLVGVATYYGTLVRGLDLPHLIRFAIFTGVPKFRFSMDLEQPTIYRVLGLMSEILEFLPEEKKSEGEKLYARLRRLIRNIPQYELMKIEEALAEGLELEGFHNHVLEVFKQSVEFLREVLKDEEVIKKIAENPFLSLKEIEGKLYIEIPDVRTYIQASGRTSRLFAGGITKGLSVIIVDDQKVFNGLIRQMRWRFVEFDIKKFEEVNLKEVLKEIDRDREKVKLVIEGKISEQVKDLVKSALMIVESPNKARTIASFFGQPSKRKIGDLTAYEVSIGDKMLTILASGGHMFDLVTNEGYHGVLILKNNGKPYFVPVYDTIKRCRDCGHQFVDWEQKGVCPRCGSRNVHDALENVKAMRELALEVDEILIGTDPDTEGEKIAWDIRNVLAPYAPNIKRIEFHEVTRPAILRAIREARDINEDRVNAQLVRRIEDRWIGFELSQKLWEVFENRNLSAGRVQTPVLGWIVQRYKEFTESETDFLGIILENGINVTIENAKGEVREVEVKDVIIEEKDVNPLPPYTTDTMLQDASRFLGFSATKTMQLAQDLFEAGLCVTPDTLVSLSDGRIIEIREAVENSEESLLGINGLKPKEAKALKFWEIDWDGPIKVIKLKNGHEIKATPDHGLLVMRDGKIGWVSAKNIREGDYVAFIYNLGHRGGKKYTLPQLLKELGISEYENSSSQELNNREQEMDSKQISIELDERFWYIFGVILGKGTLKGDKVVIFQKDVKPVIEEALPFVRIFESADHIGFSHLILAEVFRRLGVGEGKLHSLVFGLREEYINAMIAGYFDASGTFLRRAVLTSKRGDILRMLSVYLYQIGIVNNLRRDEHAGVWELIISDLEKFREKIYPYLRIKKSQFDKVYSISKNEGDFLPVASIFRKLKFRDGFKNRILDEEIPRDEVAKVLEYAEDSPEKEFLNSLVEARVTWVRVEKIEERHYTGKLYDFTTTTENFISNGIVSHNCTYHRTDSIHVSNTGIEVAKEYITQEIGEEYFTPRKWGEEGAHEAIRPTRPIDTGRLIQLIRDGIITIPKNLTRDHFRLYDLIFRRFMASQMKPAKILYEKAIISTPFKDVEVEGYIDVLYDGWSKIKSLPLRQIPKLEKGQRLRVKEVKQWRAPKVSLYTQGDVIALMKERGIGRPSTYAKIVQTLLQRGYVIETKGKKKLVPTEKGIKVYQYLITKYKDLVSEERTRQLEKIMDMVEEAKADYQDVLNELYEEIKRYVR
ncbi:reverse gyrase [Pyrococcus horikoshii]|uniref:Reverse gyrase n=2 Tax=Pyrococcus horikoshii TaxID=53953 RepID=RGYR_PYRHO|nr:reverse gyrase [Pyrococcus horikoshii]O58530.1 RecName: Full=Reverse gyrase; Contains: RecName: Full=Pho r-Gyr intein [Pyrococcus horikoshii OT3]BAA29893.1 1624aa long hypothetical reverse gyrase [Pyrococcus horikoshii OT3]HII61340.1 reverse gyrase [Pyrococcus horikoshii]